MATLEPIAEAFRTGLGLDYDSRGPEGAAGIERSFGPWYRNFLVPVALPAARRRRADASRRGRRDRHRLRRRHRRAHDGRAAYPKSTFTATTSPRYALGGRAPRASKGLGERRFHNARADPIPSDRSVDLITTFDCIHDMTDPVGMMETIRSAIKDDGVWLLVDIKGRDSFAENIEKNPMAPMMYGVSVMSCMSSALSEPGGAGLGTLGLPESLARTMTADAGFTRFRRLAIDHPVNAFYEVRP